MVQVGPGFTDEYPDAEPTSTEAFATLARAGHVALAEVEARVDATFGIKQVVATALFTIDGADRPLTPSEIGERMIIPSATMTATLDTLERLGWVHRLPNPEDRRSLLIEITEAGRAAADQMLPGIRQLELRAMSVLDEDERRQLLGLLGRVLDEMAAIEREPVQPLEGRRNRPKRDPATP